MIIKGTKKTFPKLETIQYALADRPVGAALVHTSHSTANSPVQIHKWLKPDPAAAYDAIRKAAENSCWAFATGYKENALEQLTEAYCQPLPVTCGGFMLMHGTFNPAFLPPAGILKEASLLALLLREHYKPASPKETLWTLNKMSHLLTKARLLIMYPGAETITTGKWYANPADKCLYSANWKGDRPLTPAGYIVTAAPVTPA